MREDDQIGSFAAFASANPGARFTEWLRRRAGADWDAATGHAFTRGIGDDSLPPAAYARYLIEDYAFITDLASALGFTLAKAADMPAKRRLAAFLAMLTSEENDYFLRSFAALGVPPEQYLTAVQGPVTREFAQTMVGAARDGGYEEGLACIVCAEWVYLTWGMREAQKPRPSRFYLAEWIDLHAVPGFQDFVGWLRGELDRRGPMLSAERQERVAALFARMCRLERAFFDAAVAD